jgi:hypothetical protein
LGRDGIGQDVPLGIGTTDGVDAASAGEPNIDGAAAVDGQTIGQTLIAGAVLGDDSVVSGPGIEVAAIQGALPAGSTKVTASLVATPAGLPDGFTPVGPAVDLQVDASGLAMPLVIKLRYDDTRVPDESRMLVLHYSSSRGWEPVTMLGIDPDENTVAFELAEFSPVQTGWESFSADGVFAVQHATPVEAGSSTQFSPQNDGWPLDNSFSSPESPGGHCLGMSAYTVWWFGEVEAGRAALALGAAFSSTKPWPPTPVDSANPAAPTVSIAHLTAIRADQRLSQYMAYYQYSNYWPAGPDASPTCTGPACKVGNSWCIVDPVTKAQLLCYNPLTPVQRGNLMKKIIKKWNRPLVMRLVGPSGGHAVVLFAYNSNDNDKQLYFYDVNDPFGTSGGERSAESVTFDPTSSTPFGTYRGYTDFGFIAQPSWGGYSSFDEVRSDSKNGFTSSTLLTLDHPASTEGIVMSTTPLVGTTKDISGVLYAYANDPNYDTVNFANSAITTALPINVDPGKNVLVLIGGTIIPWPTWHPHGSDPNLWHGITLVRTFCASKDGNYKWNPATNQCECPPDQTWNAAANTCESKPDGGVCPDQMTVNPNSGKCVAIYIGTLDFCTTVCSGSQCLAGTCTTGPVIFSVDEQGEVTLVAGAPSTGGITGTVTQTHDRPNFTITQTAQVAALQFTSTAVYTGTVTGDTIQGKFSSTGGEPGTTTTQTGTFSATRTRVVPDGGL